MSGQVYIKIDFATVVYDNKKDKRLHFQDMINDGWSVDEDDGLTVQFTKSKKVVK